MTNSLERALCAAVRHNSFVSGWTRYATDWLTWGLTRFATDWATLGLTRFATGWAPWGHSDGEAMGLG